MKLKMRAIYNLLPEWGKEPLRAGKRFVREWPHRGTARFCPVCGKSSRAFLTVQVVVPRADGLCPRCGSFERDRLAWLFLCRRIGFQKTPPRRLLHVAPEPCLARAFKKRIGAGYLSADLSDPYAMIALDVTAIPYPDHAFDAVYCSHVLEHVHDDRRAMREFFRVLAPGGWAMLNVPIVRDRTHEDPTICTPEARLRVFGQSDHVRAYGPDYADRLRQAGFKVDIVRTEDLVDAGDILRLGLHQAIGQPLFFCTKPEES